MRRLARLVIAGTHSGVGKTTVAMGLMAALAQRGHRVQPFKVGPDYIDPGFHAAATGRISRNLDTFLLTRQMVRSVFQAAMADADLAVIEGVMGLFDGVSPTREQGSTAEVAKLLGAPVILVVDGKAMARSIAPLVQGFSRFDPRLRIDGVIINRVGRGHFELLRDALRAAGGPPVLGYLPNDPSASLPERHLGLVPTQETARLQRLLDRVAEAVTLCVDLNALLRIARRAPAWRATRLPGVTARASSAVCRIGVARDAAFHFYYQENLELLRRLGAEIVEWSPLADAQLPERCDALYLGGGFPEVFARALSENARLRAQLRAVIRAGLPTYAECGGLMYLTQAIIDRDGRAHPMVGVLPGRVRLTDRLQHFGYAVVTPRRATIASQAGETIRGHEFHYSTWDHEPSARDAAYWAVSRRGVHRRLEGFVGRSLLASYIHVHFLSNVRWARGLIASAQRYRAGRLIQATSRGGRCISSS